MKEKKRRKFVLRRGITLLGMVVFAFSIFSVCAFGAEGSKWKDFYIRNSEILKTNDLFSSGIRKIGWGIVKGLVKFSDAVQTLYDKSFGFIDMTTNSNINDFVQRFKPAFVALTALALLYLGYILIMKHDKKPNVVTNICVAVLCVSCSTFMFGTLNGLAHSFKTGVDSYSIKGNEKGAITIVDENTIDVLKLYKKHGDSLKPSDYNKSTGGVTEKNIKYLDINNVINYKSDDFSSEENPFKYRISALNPGGGEIISENDDGWGINDGDDADFGNEFYYRYNLQWINTFIQLISLIIVYIAMSYKCVRVAFELVVARLLAYLYSAELSGGEKVRKILAFIRDSYILLGVTAICIKLYAVFTGLIHSYVGTSITSAVFSLFLAFTVIDGPNLVERLLGMDAGLKSSTARMLAIGGMAMGATKFTARTSKNIMDRLMERTKKGSDLASAGKGMENLAGNDKKAQDKMDKNSKENNSVNNTNNEQGMQGAGKDRDTEIRNSSDSVKDSGKDSAGTSPDFMDKGQNMNDKVNSDLASRMDNRMRKDGSSLGNQMDKMSRTGVSDRRSERTSMPKRNTGTKSRYVDRDSKKGE